MAEALDVFKKSFDTIKKKSDAAGGEVGKSNNLVAQTSGIVSEGVKEIGLRIQDLKDAGAEGKVLADFLGDKEVKAMHASCLSHLGAIKKELDRMNGMQKDFKKIIAERAALMNDMRAEIAKRKKAVSTKVGVGNKSLPDMEKLLAAVAKYEDEKNGLSTIMVYEPESFSDHQKQYESGLAKQIASTKDAKLSAFQQQMQEQALNVRVLSGNVGRAKTMMDAVLAECKNADAALKKRDNKALMTAKANAMKPIKGLAEMADMYKKGLADQWIKAALERSKDKDKIKQGANGVIAMYAKASGELKKVANARIE